MTTGRQAATVLAESEARAWFMARSGACGIGNVAAGQTVVAFVSPQQQPKLVVWQRTHRQLLELHVGPALQLDQEPHEGRLQRQRERPHPSQQRRRHLPLLRTIGACSYCGSGSLAGACRMATFPGVGMDVWVSCVSYRASVRSSPIAAGGSPSRAREFKRKSKGTASAIQEALTATIVLEQPVPIRLIHFPLIAYRLSVALCQLRKCPPLSDLAVTASGSDIHIHSHPDLILLLQNDLAYSTLYCA